MRVGLLFRGEGLVHFGYNQKSEEWEMHMGDTVSKARVHKILKKAGYTFGTAAYLSERRRCFASDGEGRFIELEDVRPYASVVKATNQPVLGGLHTGSSDVA